MKDVTRHWFIHALAKHEKNHSSSKHYNSCVNIGTSPSFHLILDMNNGIQISMMVPARNVGLTGILLKCSTFENTLGINPSRPIAKSSLTVENSWTKQLL
uniref:Dynein heavy chain 5, axonemal n=1 Tax=Lygus hesperus TaxID=30085 RepID=A0A0A9XEM0_LYGHE